ncbi:MAG: hypothetical protein WC662_00955 [Candidatus Paceibacterota bacterium]|jgi:cell division protein FtsW (lipid II flippase)
MDIRGVALIIIAALAIWIYFGFMAMIYLAILGLFIALIAFIYTILRAEGRIKKLLKWLNKISKNITKKYKQIEKKIFKFWDEL